MLAAMLAFFGAVVAVNAAFIVFAVGTFPGEDVRRSYMQGLHYNEVLEQRRVQHAQGWAATATLRGDEVEALLEVRMTAHDGAPLALAGLTAQLQRPATDALDRVLVFEPAGDGRYVARLGALPPGRWRLRAHAEADSGALDFESELLWPSR